MLMILVELSTILIGAAAGTVIVLIVMRSPKSRQPKQPVGAIAPEESGAVFLFQGDTLVDATNDAWDLIKHRTQNLADYDAMLAAFAVEFPCLTETLSDPKFTNSCIRSERDPSVYIDIQRTNGCLRIALNGEARIDCENAMQRLSSAAYDAHASLMQDITTHSPQLVWQEDQSGNLLWANDAYAKRKPVFKTADQKIILADALERRVVASLDGEKHDRWFDIKSVSRSDSTLHFANDATAIMRADTARSEFVRTLGKTFGELSIGLAIFNKNRQLTMFNPALVDMTTLPVDFLSASPTIDTVLDRLRELRMMPEPKNYASWREQFTAVETAAKDGTYSKNWALPDGQTFRVTGKPHPDGAFALLFEDISAEVSLNRRFRLDIETSQAVLDTLQEAIAVFSSTGTMVMSNNAYAQLWARKPDMMLEHRELHTEMKAWQDCCTPSPLWNDMRDYILQLGSRSPWKDTALLDDGRQLDCHANPIAGGTTMVRFAIAQPKRPVIQKLTAPDLAIQAAKR